MGDKQAWFFPQHGGLILAYLPSCSFSTNMPEEPILLVEYYLLYKIFANNSKQVPFKGEFEKSQFPSDNSADSQKPVKRIMPKF